MEEMKEKVLDILQKIVSQNTPMDAHTVLQEVIEEAQNLQDECLRMEYAFDGAFDEE